jgi:hypothetical protein
MRYPTALAARCAILAARMGASESWAICVALALIYAGT